MAKALIPMEMGPFSNNHTAISEKKKKKYQTVSTAHQDIPHICPTYFHNQNITDCTNQK
jgi:hypothetical protein